MLAIVIPYYKLSFFKATLESLANQTNKRFKVYIGDDASPENCSVLLAQYKEQFDFIYKRFENNLGSISLTQQWDRCIALCDNEKWLMILGDDDVLESNVIEEFYKQYNIFENKSNVVRFASVIIDEHDDIISKKFHNKIWENSFNSFLRKFENLSRSSLSEHIFSRIMYEKYGFVNYPLAWFSDDNAWLDFSEGKLIFSINEAIVFIRNSDLNISGKSDNLKQKKQATIAFYRKILSNKTEFYSKEQWLRIIYEYEITLRTENKLTIREWSSLLVHHINNFDSYAFKKFLKRSFKKVIKYE